ncbi:MAG: hypothetical protein WDO56_07625 [Gammaproteobacteria bacterium]
MLRTRLAQATLAIHGGHRAEGNAELEALIPLLLKQGKGGTLPLGQALVLQGESLLLAGKRREARQPLREALRLRETLLWDRSPDIAEARARLGEAEREQTR